MDDDIKLSILITFCNQNEFIKDALDSCLSQKVNFNYEILIGLDNGNKEAREIIKGYIEKYPSIELFEINNSKLNITAIEKASINRLNILKQAKGEYICFLDGDDFYINESRYQVMVDFLDDNSNYIAVFHDYVQYDDKTKKYIDLSLTKRTCCTYTAKDYLKIHRQFSCFIYRNIFKNVKFAECNLNLINDSTFTYYFLRYGKFFYIPQKMLAYRIGINSIFNGKNEVIQNLYSLLCAEINQKLLPQYERELYQKNKFLLKEVYKKRNLIRKVDANELIRIKDFANRQNCYFTYNLINFSNLNLLQKIKFELYRIFFIKFKRNLVDNKVKIGKLSYFNERSNFGDELNLYILQRIFNLNIIPYKIKRANLIAIGSVLEQSISLKPSIKTKLLNIFGTGFIEEKNFKKREFFNKKVNILALRGEYTKNRVEKIINKKLNCSLGDPGLLASELLEKMPNKEYQVGVILHYVDKNSSFINNIKLKNYKLIDITKNPIYVINEMAKCEIILSSAMHGLIVADSLEIPNQWIKLSDLLYGGDYKFKDYYSVFNYEPKAIDLKTEVITEKTLEKIKYNYKKLNFKIKIQKIKKELLKSMHKAQFM